MSAVESLQAGDLQGTLTQLQGDVRREPDRLSHRMSLFQLLCVLGQWERALKQLQVIAELDSESVVFAQLYGAAIRCELFRREVFAGKRAPTLMGEPARWVALMIEALRAEAEAAPQHAAQLRAEAFEAAAVTPGQANGQRFEWIADADPRLGPLLEAVVNGRYYFIPFESIAQISLEAPAALSDVVWTPAQVVLTNGGELPALIPTRYPDSEASADPAICMARRTEWVEGPAGHRGLGQRMFATDVAEHALMDLRVVRLGSEGSATAPPAIDHG